MTRQRVTVVTSRELPVQAARAGRRPADIPVTWVVGRFTCPATVAAAFLLLAPREQCGPGAGCSMRRWLS